jgi:hypothetical protein
MNHISFYYIISILDKRDRRMPSIALFRMLVPALGLAIMAAAPGCAAVAFSTASTVSMMSVDAQTVFIGSVLYTPMAAGSITAGEVISMNLPDNVPTVNKNTSLVPLTTNLLSQCNLFQDATTGFMDTGYKVSNLSRTNPSGGANTSGTITVSLYPMDGSGPYTVNTSTLTDPKAKTGLDSGGGLPPKGTWAVLLSQLLGPAGLSTTAPFSGFVRFTCNFPDAAGSAFMGDNGFGGGYAVGFPMTSDTPTTH